MDRSSEDLDPVVASVDSAEDRGFLSAYLKLPEKPDVTIRLFDKRDYYTVYEGDALLVAKLLFQSCSSVNYTRCDNRKVAVLGLGQTKFEKLLRELLLVQHYRVELWRWSRSSGMEIMAQASPGNLQVFEEQLFGNHGAHQDNIIMAVQVCSDSVGQKTVHVGYLLSNEYRFGICSFVDNEHLSGVEALLVHLNPQECLVQAGSSQDGKVLDKILSRNSVLATIRKKVDFSEKEVTPEVEKMLKEDASSVFTKALLDCPAVIGCLGAIIRNNELISSEHNYHRYSLHWFNHTQFMSLDMAAVQALNVIPSTAGLHQDLSLSALMNKCQTVQGQRLLIQWLRQPLMDRKLIEERLDLVQVFVEDPALRQSIQADYLRRFPDFVSLVGRFSRGKASLQDCVRVYQSTVKLPGLVSLLRGKSAAPSITLHAYFTAQFEGLIDDFVKLKELVETVVDFNPGENMEYSIRDDFDEGLAELRSTLGQLHEKMKSQLNKVAKDINLDAGKGVKLEFVNHLGYFLRVTLKDEALLRGNNNYTVIETRKDGVRFTTKTLKSLSEEYLSTRRQFDQTQTDLLAEIFKIFAGYASPLQSLSSLIAALDVLISFAVISSAAPKPYVRPTVLDKGAGTIQLVEARHPCLESLGNINFVSNDINLSQDKNRFVLITGPNMGGKSTFIRQVGICVLMAQVGCFVPCKRATISVVDKILARVGASDHLTRGLSTFMAEMVETASILQSATKDSLVIIDELGRGTSTYDGFGLAWSISRHIASEIGCFALFATHFHELTSLPSELDCVQNLHVTACVSDKQLVLLYKVKPGICDQSFGINIAEMVNFPPKVLEVARCRLSELEVGSQLERQGGDYSRKQQELGTLVADFYGCIKQAGGSRSDEEVLHLLDQLKQQFLPRYQALLTTSP